MADIPINNVARRVQYTGNTGTGPFSFNFNILTNSDLVVYKGTTQLTLTTHYTVSTNSNGTGSITLVDALVASDVLTLIGARNLERTTDFVTAGDLLATSLNEQLDSLVIMAQQLDEKMDRAMKVNVGDVIDSLELPLKADRLGQVLAFNEVTGNPETKTLTGLGLVAVPVSVLQGGTNSTTAEGARTNLGTTEEAEVLALALT